MNDDNADLQQAAADEQTVAALAAGELQLTPVTDPAEAAQIIAQAPFPDAPHNVIRPLRLPLDIDAEVRALAEQRGLTISAMLRELIVAGLETAGAAADPVIELRRRLGDALRAVDALDAGRRDRAA